MIRVIFDDCDTVEESMALMYEAARNAVNIDSKVKDLSEDDQENWRAGLRVISFLDKLWELLINPDKMIFSEDIRKEFEKGVNSCSEPISDTTAENNARDLAIKLIQLQNLKRSEKGKHHIKPTLENSRV